LEKWKEEWVGRGEQHLRRVMAYAKAVRLATDTKSAELEGHSGQPLCAFLL
jgi:hypothetical protein